MAQTSAIARNIATKERWLKRQHFGDLYDALLSDVQDHGILSEFDGTLTYSQGDKVIYYGSPLESKINGNTTEPCNDLDGSKWEILPRFSEDCYKQLWELHLREFLAYLLVYETLEYSSFPVTSFGVVERMNDITNERTASTENFRAVKKKMANDWQERLDNMLAWIREQKEDEICLFEGFPFDKECESKKPTTNHRIKFRY